MLELLHCDEPEEIRTLTMDQRSAERYLVRAPNERLSYLAVYGNSI